MGFKSNHCSRCGFELYSKKYEQAKSKLCLECGSTMYRYNCKYRENKIETYFCTNELCLARITVITKRAKDI